MSKLLYAVIDSDYKKQTKIFSEEVVPENSFVFLGDSMIDYFKTDEYYENTNIVNRGIAGDTAAGILNRLDQIIKIKPSVVILATGSNDYTRYNDDIDTIVKKILKIKYELESNVEGVKVYVLSLTPVLRNHEITNNVYMQTRNNDIIDEINDELSLYTKLIDVNSYLKDEDNNLRLAYTYDGLHLNKLGYDVYGKVIADEIKELKLKEKTE